MRGVCGNFMAVGVWQQEKTGKFQLRCSHWHSFHLIYFDWITFASSGDGKYEKLQSTAVHIRKSHIPFGGNLISKWNIFPQSETEWKLINYFITFHPPPARVSIKATSITVTLRNWSSFQYHISGRLISLPIAFNENHQGDCVGAKCKKLTIDSIDFICLHSL